MTSDTEALDERLRDALREIAESVSMGADHIVALRPREENRPVARRPAVVLIAAAAVAVLVIGVVVETRRPGPRVDVSIDPPVASTAAQVPSVTDRVTARLELPTRTMRAGSSMKGRVVIDNTTRHALHVGGCGSLFVVALASDTYSPDVLWPLCSQPETIPRGRSTYPVTIEAAYLACATGPGRWKTCQRNGRPPALAPGDYRAQLYQSSTIATAPTPITVHVTG